ncbi:hypothetical protein AN964_02510 [Heyndrickxia shackletonii]|uniref:Uncharacterized protein n=2 Tax=Bacillaceae TaxID=186817 RepID=A0A0Q3WV34_9BACI|nr:hypothetical protein [Heyndrickxia shackletonii]KQL52516.1 hypothetical protein AN964_02510 [Heyndrickxia shackletonii]
MQHEMGHMMMSTSSISWIFAISILVITILLVLHILNTLWEHQNLLSQLIEQHSSLIHSITMSLGMSSTITICTILGAMFNTQQNAAYIIGFIVGVLISVIICSPFKDGIAVLDGVVSGTMGGLMGVMIGTMVPEAGLYTVAILLTILFAITWIVIYRRINTISLK